MAYCCVPFCTSNSKKNPPGPCNRRISFHEFPVDPVLRGAWIKAISRKDFTPNMNSASSVVCSKHFKETDFKEGIKVKRLKTGVIPSVFPCYPSYKAPAASKPRRQLKRQSLPPAKKRKTMPPTCVDESNNCKGVDSNIENGDFCQNLETLRGNSVETSNEKGTQTEDPRDHEVLTLRKTVNRLRVQLFRKNKALQVLQAKLDKSEMKIKEIESHDYFKALKQCLSNSNADSSITFCTEQLLNSSRKRPTWNSNTIKECVLFYYISPKGYKYLRSRGIIKLPSKSTLIRYVGNTDVECGITPLIHERLTEEAKQLAEVEKCASLVIDEMAIQPKYIYDRKMDCFFGHKTVNQESSTGITPILANSVLCFLLTGLSTHYRIPCGFFFTKQLSGKQLFEFTQMVIKSTENCGFSIVRIVTDNHKINVTMMKLLAGGSLRVSINHPIQPDRLIFLAFDQSHLIKNLRTHFLLKESHDEDGIISGGYVKALYELQKNENIKPVRCLTRKHVEPSNFEKMNVKRAVQVFSTNVISALQYLKEKAMAIPRAQKFNQAGPTIKFIRNIHDWYEMHDVGNTSSHITQKNPNKMEFFSLDDRRLKWLEEEFLPYILELKTHTEQAGKTFLTKETYEALVFTTKSTVACTKYLLQNGFHYILTRKYSSDSIELLFSSLRQMSGGNDMLDARAVTFSLSKILKTGLMHASETSSVEKDAMSDVLSQKRFPWVQEKMLEKPLIQLPDSAVVILDKLAQIGADQTTEDATILQTTVAFIAGYLVRVLHERWSCNCLNALSQAPKNSALLALISNEDRGGLKYPTSSFVQVLCIIKEFAETALPHISRYSVLETLSNFVIPKLQDCPLFQCNVDSNHSGDVSKVVCDKFLRPLLVNVATKVTDLCGYTKNLYVKPLNRKIHKLS